VSQDADVPVGLDRLRAGLASPDATARAVAARPGRGGRPAAGLILLWSDADAAASEVAVDGPTAGLRLVAIEKTDHLRKHAGQIAFPGGAVEPLDASMVDAALREANEEVGLYRCSVDVLGTLPPAHVAASGFDVASVVGWWRRPVPLGPVDLEEVADVHQLSVPCLVDPANRVTAVHPSGHAGPAFLVGDLFVWGFTGHLIDALLDLAGWAQPWDAGRLREIPPRFLRGRRS
jgi:8-oxo-dGTP pyrophosphatase MutT (NUDIX family)